MPGGGVDKNMPNGGNFIKIFSWPEQANGAVCKWLKNKDKLSHNMCLKNRQFALSPALQGFEGRRDFFLAQLIHSFCA